ncbi:hypothetical protein [Micromonospora orduensis]|nr:hypothetical protein [Micromonospora orduensis]
MTKNQAEQDPLMRVHLTVPRSVCWLLAGALLGNLDDGGAILSAIGALLN